MNNKATVKHTHNIKEIIFISNFIDKQRLSLIFILLLFWFLLANSLSFIINNDRDSQSKSIGQFILKKSITIVSFSVDMGGAIVLTIQMCDGRVYSNWNCELLVRTGSNQINHTQQPLDLNPHRYILMLMYFHVRGFCNVVSCKLNWERLHTEVGWLLVGFNLKRWHQYPVSNVQCTMCNVQCTMQLLDASLLE